MEVTAAKPVCMCVCVPLSASKVFLAVPVQSFMSTAAVTDEGMVNLYTLWLSGRTCVVATVMS